MAHSFAQQESFNCQDCGQLFSTDIWLIIDAERPDLLARAACRNGHPAEVDAPLLLFRPGKASPLLFSPSQGTTAEQDQEIAIGLLGILANSLGLGWRYEWLEEVTPIPRSLLPEVLDNGVPRTAIAAALCGTGEAQPNVPERYRADVSRANAAEARYLYADDASVFLGLARAAGPDRTAALADIVAATNAARKDGRLRLGVLTEEEVHEALSRLSVMKSIAPVGDKGDRWRAIEEHGAV